jgi:spermidine synthase
VPNRDDQPLVAWRAPRLRDTPGDGPRQRLRAVVEALDADPAAVFALSAVSARSPVSPVSAVSATPTDTPTADQAAWQARVSAYWRARDHYLLAGMQVQPVPDLQAMLAQVREPLLGTLRISPDFRPAYDPLLRMAMALQRQDPAAAQALLTALAAAQPLRPEAGQALQALAAPL